jgi:hypothetical protein
MQRLPLPALPERERRQRKTGYAKGNCFRLRGCESIEMAGTITDKSCLAARWPAGRFRPNLFGLC